MGAKPQMDGTIFMEEADSSRDHFNFAIAGGLGWMKWLKLNHEETK